MEWKVIGKREVVWLVLADTSKTDIWFRSQKKEGEDDTYQVLTEGFLKQTVATHNKITQSTSALAKRFTSD